MTTMHSDQRDMVLTVEEAAKVLRIGRSAAYLAARTGELPTIRVGRSLRVPRQALDRMLSLNEEDRRAGNATVSESSARQGRHEPL